MVHIQRQLRWPASHRTWTCGQPLGMEMEMERLYSGSDELLSTNSESSWLYVHRAFAQLSITCIIRNTIPLRWDTQSPTPNLERLFINSNIFRKVHRTIHEVPPKSSQWIFHSKQFRWFGWNGRYERWNHWNKTNSQTHRQPRAQKSDQISRRKWFYVGKILRLKSDSNRDAVIKCCDRRQIAYF